MGLSQNGTGNIMEEYRGVTYILESGNKKVRKISVNYRKKNVLDRGE